jgi:alanyl aminopeptidase
MLRRPMSPTTLLLGLLAACGGAPVEPRSTPVEPGRTPDPAPAPADAGPTPDGRLPDGVVPQRYRVVLEVVPSRDTFRGEVEIDVRLAAATERIWIHGARMRVSRATVRPAGAAAAPDGFSGVNARWDLAPGREDLAALRLERAVGPGDATIAIAFEAPFDRQLKGLYRVDVGEEHYAFTHFEPLGARYAFPCFDEPRWKTPFDIELRVRREDVAISNTHEIASEDIGEGLRRVRFAGTPPLPTYLVATAVGPLDVVEAPAIPPNGVRRRPLAFRGVATRGRGPQLRYALEHTPELLAALEAYFGTEYPYDKLDIIAVPDFGSGAMENAGAITFRDQLLLIGSDAPEEQIRGFTLVMAHELAHQWFGNLVTASWWNDIWLNEAFATWMASKIVAETHPEMQADLAQLASVHSAMGQDSLAAARSIRQPIETDHDILNAFDAITYSKGGGVLAMVEQWIGEDVFREGIRLYLRQHRFGTATSEDLLGALSEAAGMDVGTPMRSFLDQPGVPLLEARLACDGEGPALEVVQSRYTPVGSTAPRDRVWQVPVCVTYPAGGAIETSCQLTPSASARIPLEQAEGCPAWVMPNAGARGYYRWALPPEQLRALVGPGWSRLSPLERVSVANNLRAAFWSAVLPGAEILAMLPPIAADETRAVATEPMALAQAVIESVAPPEWTDAARRWAASLYQARARRLGWTPRRGEDGETRLLRRDVLSFLALVARDPATRAEAARRGRAYVGYGRDVAVHPDAVASDLAGMALAVAVQEGDEAFFDAVMAHLFASTDAIARRRVLVALASTDDPALSQRALDLALDPRLRVNEVTIPLSVQAERPETRERAWAWAREHFDALAGRIASAHAGRTPWIFAGFCDLERREEVRAFFEPRIAAMPGGPRNLAGALEAITLCAARRQAQRESVERFFASRR